MSSETERTPGAVPAAEAPPWKAPHPRELPEWRLKLFEHTGSEDFLRQMSASVNAGQCTMLPTVDGTQEYTPGAIAAQLLARQELARLSEARMYHVSADMTALACAVAAKPPIEPVLQRRLPSPAGLMVFESPIGGYVQDVAEVLRHGVGDLEPACEGLMVTTPIVAVSWSLWDPQAITVSDPGHMVRWWHQAREGDLTPVSLHLRGVWLTFYTCSEDRWELFPPDTAIAHAPSGDILTAGQISQWKQHAPAPLVWDNEMVLAFGAPFAERPRADTSQQWAQVVYTAWQLITQQSGKRPVAEVDEFPRNRAGRKRDDRRGVADGTVRVINVHAPLRPPSRARDRDEASSSGRRAPVYTCRWPVPPYRRFTCLNPRKHTAGECDHEDQIVGFSIRGPEGAPLKLDGPVRVWDHQPDNGEANRDGKEFE